MSYYLIVFKEAGIFSGGRWEDPEDWLQQYKVSDVNKWDEKFHLLNVIFCLGGTAKVRYENHEEKIPSWKEFKQQQVLIFGNGKLKKQKEKAKL